MHRKACLVQCLVDVWKSKQIQKVLIVIILKIYFFFFYVGWVLIDRCGKHFNLILNFLRDGEIPLSDNRSELSELLVEAKFYCLENLCKAIDGKIMRFPNEDEDMTATQATIIIVKDCRMAKVLIASTLKV